MATAIPQGASEEFGQILHFLSKKYLVTYHRPSCLSGVRIKIDRFSETALQQSKQ